MHIDALNTDPDSCPLEVKPCPMKTIYRCGIHKLQCFQMNYQSVAEMFNQALLSQNACHLPRRQNPYKGIFYIALKSFWVQFRLQSAVEGENWVTLTFFSCIVV